ncbi:MAG TPA: MFS transporter [Candidatus Limnocylindria bacterium]|nr:MFS transporter [Candidatus Limnocylindria bacterium]
MDGGSARWRVLGLLSLAELLVLSLWFTASAVLPALSREWALGDGGRAGLTIAVQAGFIAGTLAAALTNLPDIVPARALMMWGALAGAVANAILALWVEHLTPALVLRFLTGICLAGTYPPAMKIAATWFREGRGLAIGLLVAALTVGSAAPHLIRGLTELPWRHTLLAASLAATLGALAVTLITEGPHRFPPARFDLRMAAAVLRDRGPRLACFGYFGHMWELYAMWAWLATFLAASLEARGGGSYAGLNASAATFVCVGLAGGVGAWAGGALADRWGRTTLTIAAMALSGLCAILIGLTFGGPPVLTLLVAVVWGVTVIADSAQFSTAVTELAPAAYVGTALTSQTCLGFALTMVSIWLIPPVAAWAGWRWAFAVLAVGPALGVLAMARLRAMPEARLLAGGRG